MTKSTWYLIAALVIGFLVMGPLGAVIGVIIWAVTRPKSITVIKEPSFSKKK